MEGRDKCIRGGQMNKSIIISLLALLVTVSAANAATVSGWSHSDYVSAVINQSYSSTDSRLVLTVKNTSPADSATLRGLIFSAPGATLNLREASYYSQSVSNPVQMTENWSVGTTKGASLNAEPLKYYSGLDTTLFTGKKFQGGNPQNGLEAGWTATFVFDVEGELQAPASQFIARFQSINYQGMTGSDSDFAAPMATPLPSALWLITSGLAVLAVWKKKMSS